MKYLIALLLTTLVGCAHSTIAHRCRSVADMDDTFVCQCEKMWDCR